ncbi:hypothetical protein [Desulfosporosinus youngiae]|uniref:YozE SAM-like domain-containing protein n=1 Tax=Desulfosporosinus youngiae DSM 17734 TaxID=768710 RepID=H5Y581_9FIRM|nr:hypothetical protein [Desulfosporosinus youngiae]EHQ90185.1 hypothetical protein DesyoDRAFT_3151 [Desulfosporosinus youngiae DSM 17734]
MDIKQYSDLLNEMENRYGGNLDYEKLSDGDKVVYKEIIQQYIKYFDFIIRCIEQWEEVYGKAENRLVLH